jgi:uncharacterized damage-inducible protein DinB
MSTTAHFPQLAAYNQWMNTKLYAAAAGLTDEALREDRGAFFGSVFGTLNHIAIGDILWFKRIYRAFPDCASLQCVDALPPPGFPNMPLSDTLAGLAALRSMLDEAIIAFCAELAPARLNEAFEWTSTRGVSGRKLLGDVLLHVFNHQTHHRGQATTLFSQMGIDVGATDLLLLLPDAP